VHPVVSSTLVPSELPIIVTRRPRPPEGMSSLGSLGPRLLCACGPQGQNAIGPGAHRANRWVPVGPGARTPWSCAAGIAGVSASAGRR
jgi:hypothetical protein